MTAFVRSPGYGGAVMLGPVQRDVLAIVLRLTEDGRRPELTLRRLAELTGRPYTSVHDALGRLRALGLIGVAARPGRRGGHRLWRVATRAAAALDPAKHRRAIARLVGWLAHIEGRSRPVPAITPAEPDTGRSPGLWTDPHEASPAEPVYPPVPAEPATPDHPYPTRTDPRETFRERMRRHGLGDWIDERKR